MVIITRSKSTFKSRFNTVGMFEKTIFEYSEPFAVVHPNGIVQWFSENPDPESEYHREGPFNVFGYKTYTNDGVQELPNHYMVWVRDWLDNSKDKFDRPILLVKQNVFVSISST